MNDPRQWEQVLRRRIGVAGNSAPLSFTFTADSVATHVDFSLDNLLIHKGEIAGFIDIGRAGIADRYQDINLQIIRKYRKCVNFRVSTLFGCLPAEGNRQCASFSPSSRPPSSSRSSLTPCPAMTRSNSNHRRTQSTRAGESLFESLPVNRLPLALVSDAGSFPA